MSEDSIVNLFVEQVLNNIDKDVLMELMSQDLKRISKSGFIVTTLQEALTDLKKIHEDALKVYSSSKGEFTEKQIQDHYKIFALKPSAMCHWENEKFNMSVLCLIYGQNKDDIFKPRIIEGTDSNFGLGHAINDHYSGDFDLAQKDLEYYLDAVSTGNQYRCFSQPQSVISTINANGHNIAFVTNTYVPTIGKQLNNFNFLKTFFTFEEGDKKFANYWAHVLAGNEALKDSEFIKTVANVNSLEQFIDNNCDKTDYSFKALANLYNEFKSSQKQILSNA